jgi:hypothetical protein
VGGIMAAGIAIVVWPWLGRLLEGRRAKPA